MGQGFRTDLPRWQHLVSADWLAALLAGHAVLAQPAPGWQIIEVGCDDLEAHAAGHIPGARYLDTQQLEQLPCWTQVPDAALRDLLERRGIGPDSCVILVGRKPLAAARAAHLLLVAGVKDVRLLDAGLAAWCDAGFSLRQEVETTSIAHRPWQGPFPAQPSYRVDCAQVRSMLARPDCTVVSIRTRAEFWGETSGYDYIAARGEIAGAVWGQAGSDGDAHSMSRYQTADGHMRPAAEIERLWMEAGLRPSQHLVFYCGTGWRASMAFFYAWLMGWERISVLDGGWMAWSSDPTNPVICRSTASPSPARPQSGPVRQNLPI